MKRQFQLYKVKGTENPADLFTKHLASEQMTKCLSFLGAEFRKGRPEVAPQMKEDEEIEADNEDADDYMFEDGDFNEETKEKWHRGTGEDDDNHDEPEEEEQYGQHVLE